MGFPFGKLSPLICFNTRWKLEDYFSCWRKQINEASRIQRSLTPDMLANVSKDPSLPREVSTMSPSAIGAEALCCARVPHLFDFGLDDSPAKLLGSCVGSCSIFACQALDWLTNWSHDAAPQASYYTSPSTYTTSSPGLACGMYLLLAIEDLGQASTVQRSVRYGVPVAGRTSCLRRHESPVL